MTRTGRAESGGKSIVLIPLIAVCIVANIAILVMRRSAAPPAVKDTLPALAHDSSAELNELRMNEMAKSDDKLGIKDAVFIGTSAQKEINDYLTVHNARAKEISTLEFSADSDWRDFYGGTVIPAKGEFVREEFRFTWRVGPWSRFHWNGRTGWSDTQGGGKFSADNLIFLPLQLFDPAVFTMSEVNKELEILTAKEQSVKRNVDVLESPEITLLFDREKKMLVRCIHVDPEGKRRTYFADYSGWDTLSSPDAPYFPTSVVITFIPRNQGDKVYRAATHIEPHTVVVNGKKVP